MAARGPLDDRGASIPRLHAVQRLVYHDLQQPGTEGLSGARPETPKRPVRLDYGVLRRVPGLLGVAQHQVRGPEGRFLVAAHQLLKGAGITATSLPDQRLVVQSFPPPTVIHPSRPYGSHPARGTTSPRWLYDWWRCLSCERLSSWRLSPPCPARC